MISRKDIKIIRRRKFKNIGCCILTVLQIVFKKKSCSKCDCRGMRMCREAVYPPPLPP